MYIIQVAPATFIVSEKNEATLNQNSQYSNAHPRTTNTPLAQSRHQLTPNLAPIPTHLHLLSTSQIELTNIHNQV